MGAEKRRGRVYYYSKRRVGNRVVSEYVGKGAVVDFEEHLALKRKQEKQAERERLEAARRMLADVDSQVDSVSALIDTMVKGYLTANGYRSHKGEWRKKRR